MFFKEYGKKPNGKHLESIKRSPNYRFKSFQNITKTHMISKEVSHFKIMKDFFTKKSKNLEPKKTLPNIKTDLNALSSNESCIVWFGHSSYFIKTDNKTFLIDPVFSGSASPFSFMIKSFVGTDEYQAKDFPDIDFLLITHDHYDHLDYKTILELKPKIKQVVCPLGIGAHLNYWGIAWNKITELDWWQKSDLTDDIELTVTPSRHYTGRGLKRSQMLWGSYVLKTKTCKLYLGGDSGYGPHFQSIGDKYGPFDLAILECGQYNDNWKDIHMTPEQTVQANIDLNSKVLLPVHWGKFALAMHDWTDPISRLSKKANELNITITTPLIGEVVKLKKHYPNSKWWEEI